jgi:hypothetical protein
MNAKEMHDLTKNYQLDKQEYDKVIKMLLDAAKKAQWSIITYNPISDAVVQKLRDDGYTVYVLPYYSSNHYHPNFSYHISWEKPK